LQGCAVGEPISLQILSEAAIGRWRIGAGCPQQIVFQEGIDAIRTCSNASAASRKKSVS
jgi:hypothetical protein